MALFFKVQTMRTLLDISRVLHNMMRAASLHTILFLATRAIATVPTVCISTPTLAAQAGSPVQANIYGSLSGRRCQATLKFSNLDFPDLHFGFEFLTCLGDSQAAEFTIPPEVPNGDAYLLWHCTGDDPPTCNHIWITEGQENLDSVVLDQTGTIACLVPTTTLTTLTTITGTSAITTKDITLTYFGEIVPTATNEEVFTVTDSSTTMTESVDQIYFSTMSLVSESATQSILTSTPTAPDSTGSDPSASTPTISTSTLTASAPTASAPTASVPTISGPTSSGPTSGSAALTPAVSLSIIALLSTLSNITASSPSTLSTSTTTQQ